MLERRLAGDLEKGRKYAPCSCDLQLSIRSGLRVYNDEPIAQIVESSGGGASGLVLPKVVEIDAGS